MIEKITEEEIRSLGVSALPRSPSAPSLYGGRSMDSVALRAAFDRLPICIARRLNALIDGLGLSGEEGETVAELLATGLFEGHSLRDLFEDVKTGRLAAYLAFEDGETLADKALRWETFGEEAVKRLLETDALYAERAGVTVGVPFGEAPLPDTVPLRDGTGALRDVALHDQSPDAHADLRDRVAEVEREVALRSRARVFDTWEDALVFCSALPPEVARETFAVGDRLLIRDSAVPDGWVSGFAEAAEPYPGGLGIREPFGGTQAAQAGWVILSPLEAPKVDLSEYATREEAQNCASGAAAAAKSEAVAEAKDYVKEALLTFDPPSADKVERLEAQVANLTAQIAPEYFETDASATYGKTVPSGALPYAEVIEVGGMSYAKDGEIKSAAVTAIESVGKNLAVCTEDNVQDVGGITITRTGGKSSVLLTGVIPEDRAARLFGNFRLPAGTYTASVVGLNAPDRLYVGSGNDVLVNYVQTGAPKSFTVKEEKICFMQIVFANGSTYSNTEIKVQIEKGSTATEFAPYAKHILPIPLEVQNLDGWGEGVNETYHNRIVWDPENGVKQYRQEVAKIRIDGTEEWNKTTASHIFQAGTPLFKLAGDTKEIRPIISNDYGFSDWYNPDESVKPYFRIVTNGDRLWIEATVDQFADLDAWKAYLSANPVEIVYPLATPIVTDLPTVLGDDNFIKVEEGGTLTAENAERLAAPTTVIYQRKEASA